MQAGLLKSAVMSKFEPMSISELGSFPVKDCCHKTPYRGLELRGTTLMNGDAHVAIATNTHHTRRVSTRDRSLYIAERYRDSRSQK
jgi:hypothetical protein